MYAQSSQQFELVFDAARGGFHPLPLVLPGLVLVVIGCIAIGVTLRLRTRRTRAIAAGIGTVAVAYGLWWSAFVYRENRAAYDRLRDALATGEYQTIVGPVSDFQKETRSGRVPERWTVAGHTYELSSYRLPRTALYPGLVKPGMIVRITEVDGQIARFEIAR